jgi:hypothetical protein
MGYSTLLMGKGFDQSRNSVKQIVEFLTNNPDQTETEIQEKVWGYYRYAHRQLESNKKYADLLRRAVAKGLICRIEKKKNRSRFVYNVASPISKQVELNQTAYRVEEYVDRNSGNVCELFQVVADGVLIYERDYGSVSSGIISYLKDYEQFYIEKNQ